MTDPHKSLVVTSLVPQSPIDDDVDIHFAPTDQVLTALPGKALSLDELRPGEYSLSPVSASVWGEALNVSVKGDEATQFELPVVPLSAPCWKRTFKTCVVLDVRSGKEIYVIYWTRRGPLPGNHLRPHDDEIEDQLSYSLQVARSDERVGDLAPVPTVLFGPGTSFRRVRYVTELLKGVGFESIDFSRDQERAHPDQRTMSQVPPVELRSKEGEALSPATIKAAFSHEELWFRQCFAQAKQPGDWVLFRLSVDRDGLVGDISLTPGPSRPPEPEPANHCSEYDEYVGRCHRESDGAAAPPIEGDLWTCLHDAARRLRFGVDGEDERNVEFEIKGRWLEPAPEPPRPSDELGK